MLTIHLVSYLPQPSLCKCYNALIQSVASFLVLFPKAQSLVYYYLVCKLMTFNQLVTAQKLIPQITKLVRGMFVTYEPSFFVEVLGELLKAAETLTCQLAFLQRFSLPQTSTCVSNNSIKTLSYVFCFLMKLHFDLSG